MIIISGYLTASATTANIGLQWQVSHGTGTAPARGAALQGTQVGQVQRYDTGTTLTAAADLSIPFCLAVVVTGLSLNVAHWIDLAVEAVTTANSVLMNNINVAAEEI